MSSQEFEKKIDKILFNEDYPNLLFKNGTKPYIESAFRFKHARKVLNHPTNKVIYDIGPYPGNSIFYFGEFNKITGIGKSTKEFTEKFLAAGHNIIDINFESDEIPQEFKGKADIVLLMEIIEHIRQPYMFLKKIETLLAPGGIIYVTTNNFSYIGYLLKLLGAKPILDPINTEDTFYPGHCRYYLLEELAAALEQNGYIVKHKTRVNLLPSFSLYKNVFFGAAKNILIKSMPKRYSTHIELIAQKK